MLIINEAKIFAAHCSNEWSSSPLEWAKVKSKYANRKPICDFYLMAIAQCSRCVTILEILAVERCMTLTLTFKMGQSQM